MRGDSFVRQHRLLERLRDGRARNFTHFEDIRLECHVTRKTIQRDLTALSRIPELRFRTFTSEGKLWYRSTIADEKPDAFNGPKTCSKCGATKAVEEFGHNKRNADGRENQCNKCRAGWRRGWAFRHRKRVNANMRRWRQRRKR